MGGVILGIEIFFGFAIGYWLLVTARSLWKRFRGRMGYWLRFSWHFTIEFFRELLKALIVPSLVFAAGALLVLGVYLLGESHRAAAESIADVLAIAGMLAIAGFGGYLLYLIFRPRRQSQQ